MKLAAIAAAVLLCCAPRAQAGFILVRECELGTVSIPSRGEATIEDLQATVRTLEAAIAQSNFDNAAKAAADLHWQYCLVGQRSDVLSSKVAAELINVGARLTPESRQKHWMQVASFSLIAKQIGSKPIESIAETRAGKSKQEPQRKEIADSGHESGDFVFSRTAK